MKEKSEEGSGGAEKGLSISIEMYYKNYIYVCVYRMKYCFLPQNECTWKPLNLVK